MTKFVCVGVGYGGTLKKLVPISPPLENVVAGSTAKRSTSFNDPGRGSVNLLECPKCGRFEVDNSDRNPPTPATTE